MNATYAMNTNELTPRFITVLKKAYPGKQIEIAVQEISDETDFLLNDDVLMQAVKDIETGSNLVAVSF